MAITSIAATTLSQLTPASSAAASGTAAAGGGFTDALRNLLETVDGTTGTANTAVSKMLGGTGDVHEAMIALQRAEMTMQLTVQVRNKLVAAYQDVMRMPI